MDWLLTCFLAAGIVCLIAIGIAIDERRAASTPEAEREEDWINQQW